MSAASRLAGGVAHDLNNLLMIIRGNLELFDDSQNDEDRAERIAAVLDASADIEKLSQRLHVFSRDEWPDRLDLDFNAAAESAAARIEAELHGDFKVDCAPSAGLWTVAGDRAGAESAIFELGRYVCVATPDTDIVISTENVRVPAISDEMAARDFVAVIVAIRHPPRDPLDEYSKDMKRRVMALGPAYGLARLTGGFVDADPAGAWAALYLPRAAADTAARLQPSANAR
jgi:two-component system NtrC family sensor kinase